MKPTHLNAPSNFFQTQHSVNLEPSNRWVRVKINGVTVADSKQTLLFLDWNINYPTYFFPKESVNMDILQPSLLSDGVKNQQLNWSVKTENTLAENAAWGFKEPPKGMEILKEYITFKWHKPLEWFEEEEEVFVHARDPHKRIDVLKSTRHVQIKIAGQIIADTHQSFLLFETFLPTRYYIAQEDIRMEFLQNSPTASGCAYKGVANYWSVMVGKQLFENIVWGYAKPNPECFKIKNLLCFFNEKVDIYVDGELEMRPDSPFS